MWKSHREERQFILYLYYVGNVGKPFTLGSADSYPYFMWNCCLIELVTFVIRNRGQCDTHGILHVSLRGSLLAGNGHHGSNGPPYES